MSERSMVAKCTSVRCSLLDIPFGWLRHLLHYFSLRVEILGRHRQTMYSFQCRIQLQNTVQNTNRRLFQRYSAQELVHIYLRRASGTRVHTVYTRAKCTVQV